MSYNTQLYNRLKEAGLTGSDSLGHQCDLDRSFAQSGLNYIPESVSKRLLDAPIDTDCSFEKNLDNWCKDGLLNFKPFVLQQSKADTPSLMLRYNKYLHLFRNYSFHVSYTHDGSGEYSSACVRTDAIHHSIKEAWDYYASGANQSDLYQALMYMNAIAAASCIDAFNSLLESNPEVVDDFMKRTMRAYRLVFDYNMTYEKLRSYIVRTEGDYDYEHTYRDIYRVAASDTMDYCRLRVHEIDDTLKVSIEVMENSAPVIYVLNMPYLLNAETVAKLSEDELDEVNSVWDTFKCSRELLLSQIVFLLNTFGYTANYIVVYPNCKKSDRDKMQKLKALNNTQVITLDDLNPVIV